MQLLSGGSPFITVDCSFCFQAHGEDAWGATVVQVAAKTV